MIKQIGNWLAARKARKQLCDVLGVSRKIPDIALAYLAYNQIDWFGNRDIKRLYGIWRGNDRS